MTNSPLRTALGWCPSAFGHAAPWSDERSVGGRGPRFAIEELRPRSLEHLGLGLPRRDDAHRDAGGAELEPQRGRKGLEGIHAPSGSREVIWQKLADVSRSACQAAAATD